jgi:hypothetical protein
LKTPINYRNNLSICVPNSTSARNICNKLILNAKTKYYSSISEKIHTETTGSKNWWNLVKSLLGDSNNRSIPPIQTDDDITHDDTEKSI